MLKPLFNIQWWHHLQAQAKEASYEKIENSMKSANRKKKWKGDKIWGENHKIQRNWELKCKNFKCWNLVYIQKHSPNHY